MYLKLSSLSTSFFFPVHALSFSLSPSFPHSFTPSLTRSLSLVLSFHPCATHRTCIASIVASSAYNVIATSCQARRVPVTTSCSRSHTQAYNKRRKSPWQHLQVQSNAADHTCAIDHSSHSKDIEHGPNT